VAIGLVSGACKPDRPAASAGARPLSSTPPARDPGAPTDVAAAPGDARKSDTGLAWKVLAPGTGKIHPALGDSVKVRFTGWSPDGNRFDSSDDLGHPATYRVGRVIPGWTEALQSMVAGEKRRLWVPSNLAHGDKPDEGKPRGSLVFDLELLEVIAAPAAPEDVAAPPRGVRKTKSGLTYRVLAPGTGKERPGAASVVTVRYSGWTTDGKLFDSTFERAQPADVTLASAMPGWIEGLQLMVVGEKTRFWIPSRLAYGDDPAREDAPSGMLVFDVELLGIKQR
jgi:peptidylprolyl isomerase